MQPPGAARSLAIALLGGGLVCACGGQGSVTFQLESPMRTDLSPLLDPRRNNISLTDESNGPLGMSVAAGGAGGVLEALGSLPVGRFNLRLDVTGGAQLLGLARARGVNIAGGKDQSVVLHLRKPIAYFGSAQIFGTVDLPGPDALMAIDSTLPAMPLLPRIALDSPLPAIVTVSSNDGQYLLAASGATVFLIDTATNTVLHQATILRAGKGAPVVRDLFISPDDASLAIVSDSGISLLANLKTFAAGTDTVMLTETPLVDLRRVAWSPDGATIATIAGDPWQAVDCRQPRPTTLYTMSASDLGSAMGSAGPPGATDVAFDATGRLLVAAPCGAGVQTSGGDMVLPGAGIYDVVVSGARVLGVQGQLRPVTLPFDPDDPTIRPAQVPEGQISITGQPQPTTFLLPADRISVQPPMGGNLVQIRLQPSSMAAYRVAASPDGTHLIYANRVRYEASGFKFVDLVDQNNQPVFYCSIDIKRDVYHVTEVDLASGSVGYQSSKGINDLTCQTVCTDCYLGPCQNGMPAPCSVSTGYVPDGVSVLMGTR